MKGKLRTILEESDNRNGFWTKFINANGLKRMAEVGVYRGVFAEEILRKCPQITEYTMVDPWRNLEDWNKPANENNEAFEVIYKEAMKRTDFAKEKRIVLRGKTTEVVGHIEKESVDFAYVDGDHTLRGITIDLMQIWPKIKQGGFVGGDDFGPSIWQHNYDYEPTMVFPYAVYFAEAVEAKVYALPFNQFLMEKSNTGFEFTDLTNGRYADRELRKQFVQSPVKYLKRKLRGR